MKNFPVVVFVLLGRFEELEKMHGILLTVFSGATVTSFHVENISYTGSLDSLNLRTRIRVLWFVSIPDEALFFPWYVKKSQKVQPPKGKDFCCYLDLLFMT